MTIDFKNEINEITPRIKLAEDYLSCENIIIANIKKHFSKEDDIPSIEKYLKQLYEYFKELIIKNSESVDYIKFLYTSNFLKTLNESTYWHSWVRRNI
jgi:hypothetical protein